ncbi:hypothetical protein [Nocardia sp. NPDC050175]|uniref:hypothetical protein n=1 Tax=Nocardia sp. NPDC050175 TaxID=3364317 RepID=UPI003799FAB9
MATVGISTERTVVRGVLLTDGPEPGTRPGVVREVHQQVDEDPATAVVVAVLDRLTTESDLQVDDVAVTYRTVAERRALVSHLSSLKWRSASLVSARSALLAVIQDMPGLDEFGTVLVVEALSDHTCCAVIGPDRARIMAADSWPVGLSDADSTSKAISRMWPMLDAISARPDAVVLCGAAAAEPEIATVLQLALTAPVLRLPDFANAAARGAALVAAEQIRNPPAAIPRDRRPPIRLLLSAAALATLLGASSFTIAQLHAEHSPVIDVLGSSAEPAPPQPATSAMLPPIQPSIAREPGEPRLVPPTRVAAPLAPRPAHTTSDSVEPPPPSSSNAPEPSAAAAPTTVGAPNSDWLFPGEPPPPPAGSDPAAVRAWWDNHFLLKERWLHGG